MIESLIQQIFNKDATNIVKLEKGLTNKNYKITVDNKDYVLRVPYEDSAHVVNYVNEEKALQLVKSLDIDVKTVYYNPNNGIKVTKYVDNLLGFNEYTSFDKYEKVGKLMRKLHSLKTLSHNEFDPIKIFKTYRNHIEHPMISDDRALLFINYVQENRQVSTLCHNDWVADNIGFHTQREYLLDYEYAGDNDPMFDVTSFLSENNITNPIFRHQFLEAYFDKQYPKNLEQTLMYWEGFHHLLWNTWAIMMFNQRKTPVFQKIANEKKQAFDDLYSQLK